MNNNTDVPMIGENPLNKLDEDKPNMMKDFKKTLDSEMSSMRGMIETHVRTQMGLNKPTREAGSQTFTFPRLRDEIEHEVRLRIEK